MTDEKTVSSEETVDENFTQEETPVVQTLSLQELDQIAQVIDLASQRGAFRGGELQPVGALYNKLVSFLSSVKAQQEAASEASNNDAESAGDTDGEE